MKLKKNKGRNVMLVVSLLPLGCTCVNFINTKQLKRINYPLC